MGVVRRWVQILARWDFAFDFVRGFKRLNSIRMGAYLINNTPPLLVRWAYCLILAMFRDCTFYQPLKNAWQHGLVSSHLYLFLDLTWICAHPNGALS